MFADQSTNPDVARTQAYISRVYSLDPGIPSLTPTTCTLRLKSQYITMATTMLGGFYVPGNNRVVLQDTPIPTPTAKQVLLKVVAAGVCHSDVFFLNASTPDPRTYILGHENAGYAVSYVPASFSTPHSSPGKLSLTDDPSGGVRT